MTRVRKSPSMPLYGKDAYTDVKFATSPWDVQGLFWRLAWWQWDEGSIPDDVQQVVDAVGKPRETRRLWKTMVAFFFVRHPSLQGRRYNVKLDELRIERFADRDRHGTGKRTGIPDDYGPEFQVNSNGNSAESTRAPARAADANVVSVESNEEAVGESARGEGELSPQQQAVKRVLEALEKHTTAFLLPSGGRIAKWTSRYGVDVVLAAIEEEGEKGNLDGRNPSYLQQCIESRKWRGNGTGKRSNGRTERGRNSTSSESAPSRDAPTFRDFGGKTIDDVLPVRAKR